MSVPSHLSGRVDVAMQTHNEADVLLFEPGDPEWVADLLDTMQAGDVEAVLNEVTSLVEVLRKASKARRMLATVGPDLFQAGVELRNGRKAAS